MSVRIFSAYDRGDAPSPVVDCSVEPSLVKQSFKDECDVNFIMARYEKTGVLEFSERQGEFSDFDPVDFQEAMNMVASGNSLFEAMPAHQRAAFDNDPVKFFAACHDSSARPMLESLGLIKPVPQASSEGQPGAAPSASVAEGGKAPSGAAAGG